MPDHRHERTGPMQDPSRVRPPHVQPRRPKTTPAGLGPDHLESIGRLAGNRAAQELVRPSGDEPRAQRVEIDLGRQWETIYERPSMTKGGVPIKSPTKGQKDFVATSYRMDPKYEMTRGASSVDVEVRIHFVDQARGTNQWQKGPTGKFLTDKKGKKIPDKTYRRNVGKVKAITDAARIKFAKAQCAAITSIWSGNYVLHGKQEKVLGGALDTVPVLGDLVRPSKTPIKLKLNFRAKAIFGASAPNAHTTVRLFGMGVVAKRSGAHPIDAGHWYMDTKTNYGGTNITAISAHEYGHLLGLHDEYSRSNDQVHQQLHLMGGKARTSHKALDAHTTRHMVTRALYPAISAAMGSNIAVAGAAIVGAKSSLQKQLSSSLRSTWRDAGVRSALVSGIEPSLSTARLKRALRRVVNFQTGVNFSNRAVAKGSFTGLAAGAIKKAAMDEMGDWYRSVINEVFEVKGADKTATSFRSSYSANFRQAAKAGAGTKAGAVVQSVVGSASVGVPKLPPSPTIMNELAGLPKYWSTPGKGLDAAYTPAVATKQVANSVKTAIAAKLFDGIGRTGELYRPIYDLVQSAATKSAEQAVTDFVDAGVREKVKNQLVALRGSIDNEIQAALGMSAGGAAVKSADPNMKAVAQKYLGMLQAQQNKKLWKQEAIINPGAGSGDVDVRYTASSIMGNNNPAKSGFRTDMIAPVVKQFNARLRNYNESKFVAKKA